MSTKAQSPALKGLKKEPDFKIIPSTWRKMVSQNDDGTEKIRMERTPLLFEINGEVKFFPRRIRRKMLRQHKKKMGK